MMSGVRRSGQIGPVRDAGHVRDAPRPTGGRRGRCSALVLVFAGVVVTGALTSLPSAAQSPTGVWQMRICFSDKLKRSDPSLAASELRLYPLTFGGTGQPDLTASVGFPDGLTLSGRMEGTEWAVTNWYVGNNPNTTTRSRGTATVTFGTVVATGRWTTIKGSTGTWLMSTGTPAPCPAAGVANKTAATSAPAASSGVVRVRVQTAPNRVAGISVRLGATTVTTTSSDVFADVPAGPVTISARGATEVRSILIRSTGGDALAGDGTGAHCTGASASLVLDPSSQTDVKQDYILIVGLPGSTTPRGPCKGTRIGAPRSATGSGYRDLKRFDAEVTFAGAPFLSPNCATIASQHIQVSIHGGVGGSQDPFYGGGNISEYAPREIVPGSPKAPPDCESNGFVFWAIDGDFSVQLLPTGAVRTLVLRVWVSGGGDRSRPRQCQTPVGQNRLVGTITLIDSDEFLRPQGITADAIEFGPFGTGCTAHDRAFSNVAFASGIGWVSKASVELSCEAPGRGLSPANCVP